MSVHSMLGWWCMPVYPCDHAGCNGSDSWCRPTYRYTSVATRADCVGHMYWEYAGSSEYQVTFSSRSVTR